MLERNSSRAASQTSSAPVVFVVICSGQLSQYTGALQERPPLFSTPLLSVFLSLSLSALLKPPNQAPPYVSVLLRVFFACVQQFAQFSAALPAGSG